MKRVFSFFFMMAIVAIFSVDCSKDCQTLGTKITGKLYMAHENVEINGVKVETKTYFYYNENYVYYATLPANSLPTSTVVASGTKVGHPNAKQEILNGLSATLPSASNYNKTFLNEAITPSILGIKKAVVADGVFEIRNGFFDMSIKIDTYEDPKTPGKYTSSPAKKRNLEIKIVGDKLAILNLEYQPSVSAYTATGQSVIFSETPGL